MSLDPYRGVLALPGVRPLLLLGLFARIPATAVGMTLTLHTVGHLGRSYGAAGLVTALYTIGAAIGSPLLGRLTDRKGIRPTVALTTAAQAVVWVFAPFLPYEALLVAAVVAGLLAIPFFGLVRQAIAAMVPPEQRRPAYALDSMGTELSFMVGPAVAVAAATTLPPQITLYILGGCLVVAGIAVFVLDPKTRAEGVMPPAEGRRRLLTPPVIAVLVTACAMTFVLSGTELGTVATLREAGAVRWVGLVIGLWCAYSLVGGLIFGMLHRPMSSLTIVGSMALLSIPVGLAPSWQWICLTLIPAGLLCAPSITSGNETLTRLVPEDARGEALGIFGSAMTAGVSMGAPFAGWVADHFGPSWAFVAVGGVGLLAVGVARVAYTRAQPAPTEPELQTA